MDKILLFIPAYNCEKQIGRVLNKLDLEVMKYISEVIVIDNRSKDGTRDEVLKFKREHPDFPIKLFMNTENYGLGGSQKVGFGYMRRHGFKYVVMLHGDDQGDVRDFMPVFSRRLYRKYDCVLGARFMRGSKLQGYSLVRTLGNVAYNLLFALITKRRVFDLGSGLNMYSLDMLQDGFYFRFPDDLTFNYCMVLAISYFWQNARYFPVSWREEDQVSNVKLFSQARKVLGMALSYAANNTDIGNDYRSEKRDFYCTEEILANGTPSGNILCFGEREDKCTSKTS